MTDPIKRPKLMMYRDPATGQTRTSHDGCWVYHTCLDCPLPRCVYDSSITPKSIDRSNLHLRISALLAEGVTWHSISASLNVSPRTVARQAVADRERTARSPRAADALAH